MAERSRLSQLPGTHFAQAHVLASAATNDDEQPVWTNKHNATVRITSVGFIPDADITGAATNNFIVQLRNKGVLGTSTTGVTALKTFDSGTDADGFLEDAQTLSTTDADLDIDAGETVAWNKTENGTGLDMPAGIVTIGYQFSQ